jgi:hypothetical protein
MLTSWLAAIFKPGSAVLLGLAALCGPAVGQEVSYALLRPEAIAFVPAVKPVEPAVLPEAPSHRFWDRENSLLFATSAGFSAADFVETRNNLRNGGQELNPVTRLFAGSTAGLAVNFVGETVCVVGVSYLFHKTGHHKLERAVSMLNIGASATAVTFDRIHR